MQIKRELTFDKTGNKASGYVAVYNSPSKPMTRSDGMPFIEVIRQGAFDATLKDGHNIFALSSHNREDILGSTLAGTLILRSDANGLWADITLPETTAGNDTKTLLARGEPMGGSFCAAIDDWQWSPYPQENCQLCELKALTLSECTITAFPAYPETSIVLRSNRHPALISPSKQETEKEIENYKYKLRMLQLL